MARTTLPLFPTDDGWPYPDGIAAWDDVDDREPDLDALELRADPHAFDALTAAERAAVVQHFGLEPGPDHGTEHFAFSGVATMSVVVCRSHSEWRHTSSPSAVKVTSHSTMPAPMRAAAS